MDSLYAYQFASVTITSLKHIVVVILELLDLVEKLIFRIEVAKWRIILRLNFNCFFKLLGFFVIFWIAWCFLIMILMFLMILLLLIFVSL